MPAIKAFVVPHNQQRYNTVGDYFQVHDGRIDFRISEMGNADYEFLVLIHELIEAHLCKKRNISFADITAFDLEWDLRTEVSGEPGASPDAPYHKEHMFATAVEELIAKELGVDWDEYENMIDALCSSYITQQPSTQTLKKEK